MITLLALLLAGQAELTDAEALAQLERNRIDVVAEQLRNFRGRWDVEDDGDVSCRTARSTGKADLDVLACDAIRGCVFENLDLIERRDNRRLPRAERRALKQQTKDVMSQCASKHFAGLRDRYTKRLLAGAAGGAGSGAQAELTQ